MVRLFETRESDALIPKKYALPLLAAVASIAGYGGGQLFAPEPGFVTADAYETVERYARLAEKRNAEWETCWEALRRVQSVDHEGCPPAYVSANAVFPWGDSK